MTRADVIQEYTKKMYERWCTNKNILLFNGDSKKKSNPCHYQLKSKEYTTKGEGKMRRKKQK